MLPEVMQRGIARCHLLNNKSNDRYSIGLRNVISKSKRKSTPMRDAINAMSMLFARPQRLTDTDRKRLNVSTDIVENRSSFDFEFSALNGEPLPLRQFRGRVLLIVNTASKCGFTPQYEGLQKLYDSYRPQGLTVIGVPSNDFAKQEPGTAGDISAICVGRYGVTFPITQKEHVIGSRAHAFYRWAQIAMNGQATPKWNFHKYLVRRDGRLAGSFPPLTSPTSRRLTRLIEAELQRYPDEVGHGPIY